DRRMQCLERQLGRLRATVGFMLEADANTVRRAPQVVDALPSLARCQHPATSPDPPPPSDPGVARAVEALNRRLATVDVLIAAGRYHDGLSLARRIYDEAKAIDHPALLVDVGRRVGALLLATGEHADAEESLTEAAIAAQALPYDQAGVEAMTDLVLLLGEHLARPEEAMTWAGHARATLRRSPDPRAEARLWTTESVVEMARGDYEAARERATLALDLRRRTLGEGHGELVGAHNNLANALRRLGRYAPAQHQYQRALEIAEQVYGKTHPLTATLLQNLGGLFAEQGQYAQAEPALERALSIRRYSLGPRHPQVATVLNNLGSLAQAQGDDERALEMLTEALDIQEQALGRDDVKHVPLLHNLAAISLSHGNPEQARRHGQRALGLLSRFRQPDHPRLVSTLLVLGRVDTAQGKLAEGRDRLHEALALVDGQIGENNPISAGVHEALGELEQAAGRRDKEVEHLATALRLREAAGHAEQSVASLRFSLARARASRGDPPAAVSPLLSRARAAAGPPVAERIDAWIAEHPQYADPP
ncbi:MAG: tetratricopeptide repeat protein, partial [Deltaproteobacteria bacterium]|nr:tetratricopeptide repeat protein [Deltaproteobacteria bacterium]